MKGRPTFSDESVPFDPREQITATSPELSCVSIKSTASIYQHLEFSDRPVGFDPSVERGAQSKCGLSSSADATHHYMISSVDALKERHKHSPPLSTNP
ncbi:hypothetical protein QQF64_036336 [Cirrhinus molitorella]|uniref:Uncharacterized protein n=1 Tax=Cirrhinus molitorella TaxID=172907 RepID=A0ABR3NJ55_9TELE